MLNEYAIHELFTAKDKTNTPINDKRLPHYKLIRKIFKEFLEKDMLPYCKEKTPAPITVFISYAWATKGSDTYEQDFFYQTFVQKFAHDLRDRCGIKVYLDGWYDKAGKPLTDFLEDAFKYSNYFLVMGTKLYLKKYAKRAQLEEDNEHVVRAEGTVFNYIATYSSQWRGKIIPVLLEGSAQETIPSLLRPNLPVVFNAQDYFESFFYLLKSLYNIDPDDKGFRKLVQSFYTKLKAQLQNFNFNSTPISTGAQAFFKESKGEQVSSPQQKIELDLKELNALLEILDSKTLKYKLETYVKEASERIEKNKRFLNLTDPGKKLFRKAKASFIEELKVNLDDIKKDKYGEMDKEVAAEWFSMLAAPLYQWSPPLRLESEEERKLNQKQEEKLFVEQVELSQSKLFSEALQALAKAKIKNLVTVYILCDVAPEKEFRQREASLKEGFFNILCTHLEQAGVRIMWDQKDSFSGMNPAQLKNKLLQANCVLLLGTESFRKKWVSNKRAFALEQTFLELKWLDDLGNGNINEQRTTLIPYVVTGIRETAFPDELLPKQDITIASWAQQGYLKALSEILAAVYGVHKKFIHPYFESVLKETPTYISIFKM